MSTLAFDPLTHMQRLSSNVTELWHYVVTPLWILGCAIEIMHFSVLALDHALHSVTSVEWAVLGVTIIGTAFTVWFARLIWAVRLTGGVLVVTRYRQEIRVPLEVVESVHDDRVLWSPVTVAIRLRQEVDAVGRAFRFLPRPHWFRWPPREAPDIAELFVRRGAHPDISPP